MSLKHAILVMLEQEPSSGYDLLQQFKNSLGYFWNAKHQQIYLQLKKLSEEALISYEYAEQSGKPNKKVYSITALGRAELVSWLSQPVAPNRVNDALLVKIYGGHLAPPAEIDKELDVHIALHQTTLDKLLKIEEKYLALAPQAQSKYRYPYLTLRRGIIGEEAWLKWAYEAKQLFKK